MRVRKIEGGALNARRWLAAAVGWLVLTTVFIAPGCTLSRSGTLSQSCSTNENCKDFFDAEHMEENTCTTDTCLETGICDNVAFDEGTAGLEQPPNDCKKYFCSGGKRVAEPDDQDFPDENDCVDARCVNGELELTNEPVDTACTEGAGSGKCDGDGTCLVTCTMPDDPVCDDGNSCTIDVCNLLTGVCDRELLDNTAPPDMPNVDGDCRAFLCVGGQVQILDALTDIPVDGNDCTDDICVPGSNGENASPQNPFRPVDSACGTGGALLCDGMGNCQNCNSNDDCGTDTVCLVYSCMNTTCVQVAQTGSACNDGDMCNGTDTCGNTGQCSVHVNGVTCTASDQCHNAGTCNPANGNCSNPNKPNNTGCNDGNACTQSDTCQGGVCTGANPVTCTASDQCHNAGTCNPANGNCSNPNKPDNTGCDDGVYCTDVDTCQGGVCTGTGDPCTPPACVNQNECNTGGCNEGMKNCTANMGAGVPCDDGGMPGCTDANTTCDGLGACN